MNFSASSRISTGALRYSTAFHSSQLRGVMENNSCREVRNKESENRGRPAVKNGIYKIPKCSAILRSIEATRKGFFHTGNLSKLSFSDREFMALNISTVTRIERLIVVAVLDISFVNISQPISGKSEGHW